MKSMINLLANDGYLIYNKELAHKVGVHEAIILGELISEYVYYTNRNELTEDNMFYSTIENVQKNTALNEFYQRKALKHLKELGLINCVLRGIPRFRYISINELAIIDLLCSEQVQECAHDISLSIPLKLWKDNNLGITDLIVFERVTSNEKLLNFPCSLSNSDLSELCRCSESEVSKSITKLIDSGYLKLVFYNGKERFMHSIFNSKVEINSQQTNTKQSNQKTATGYIYIFKCGDYYKIGTSKNVKNRLNQLNCERPYKVELVFSSDKIQTPYVFEKKLHNHFNKNRIANEWFDLSNRDISIIKRYLNRVANTR